MPIDYVMHALATYKSNSHLKDLTPTLSPPASVVFPRTSQPQVRLEVPPILTSTSSSASVPCSSSTTPSLVYLQDQPISVYTVPMSSNGDVQYLVLSTTAPRHPRLPCQEFRSFKPQDIFLSRLIPDRRSYARSRIHRSKCIRSGYRCPIRPLVSNGAQR